MKNNQTTQNLALIKRLKKELAAAEAPATKEQVAEAQAFITEAQAFIAAGKGNLADFHLLKARIVELESWILATDHSQEKRHYQSLLNDAKAKAQLPEEKCTHDFIAREYTSQCYGTCLNCGETFFNP